VEVVAAVAEVAAQCDVGGDHEMPCPVWTRDLGFDPCRLVRQVKQFDGEKARRGGLPSPFSLGTASPAGKAGRGRGQRERLFRVCPPAAELLHLPHKAAGVEPRVPYACTNPLDPTGNG